jgi:pectate lyase
LRVTYHHNYWHNINSRLPSLRFGTGHIYSSCYEDNPTSGINSRMGAQVLVEQCYFGNTKLAIVTNLDSDQPGSAVSQNNLFSGSDTRITQTGSLTPPYSYVLDTADCVCGLVKSKAGTGVVG